MEDGNGSHGRNVNWSDIVCKYGGQRDRYTDEQRIVTIHSRILHKTGEIEIGLKSEGPEGDGILGMGV